jgi:3-oxoacyl-(acyl-carrier-protein) synthase
MIAAILATGVYRPETVDSLLAQPEFRRSTRNMALAYSTIQDLCERLPPNWLSANADRLAFVLGTSHGELDATVQFLTGLGASGMARPFVFQSSLHNATLGFLSQMLKLRGPAVTVSHHYYTGEDALTVGGDLLSDGSSEFALVVGIDGLISGTESAFQSTYPPGIKLTEGAGAVLLGRADEKSLPPLAWLEKCSREKTTLSPRLPHYDANAVECLARAVREPSVRRLELPKPDQTLSVLSLRREL